MLRAVVGAIMSVFVGVLLLWFIYPLLNTSYESVKSQINMTNPVNAQLVAIGNGVYMMLPWVTFIVVAYLIFAYATKNVPFDIGG
jgi:multisubunit Na+/H+ antiporter MnhB subunit